MKNSVYILYRLCIQYSPIKIGLFSYYIGITPYNIGLKNKCVWYYFILSLIILSCNTSKSTISRNDKTLSTQNDTIRIANDSLKYEVIIIDPGFSSWLAFRAFPRGYHSQSYLENKNQLYVREWNNRVLQPQRYNTNLYEMSINYDYGIDYGYEVNYLIYNYMIYFQNTFNQRLNGYVPTR